MDEWKTITITESEYEKTEKSDLRNVPKGIIRQFIETYKFHPALWQVRNKHVYNNKSLKSKGYKELLKVLKEYDPDADVSTVKIKLQSLRGCFRKELRKVEKSLELGDDPVYESNLWYYDLFRFLINQELSPQELEEMKNDSKQTLSDTSEDPLQELSTTIKKRHIKEEESTVSDQQKIRKSNDYEHQVYRTKYARVSKKQTYPTQHIQAGETETFSLYINSKLTQITNLEQRMYAETLLTKVLNKAIMGRLTEVTDVVDTEPYSSRNISYFTSEASASPLSAQLEEETIEDPSPSCL